MSNITPCIRFNTQAEEAVNLYTSLFQNTKIGTTARYDEASAKVSGMPAGSVLTAAFELEGLPFLALNGGPLFKLTPATSFFVTCETVEEVDRLRATLSQGGQVMMPLQNYPFSEKYGRVNDKFGVSRQLFVGPKASQKISPCLMYVGDKAGRCEEAINLYTSIFPNSTTKLISRYEEGEYDKVGLIKHAEFTLDGYMFMAMESTLNHQFGFTEAISYIVNCEDQAEVDHYRNKLTADGGEESQCGRLKDKFGVSRQITPTILNQLISSPDATTAKKAMQAMLQMKKIDIAVLEAAVNG